MAIEMFPAALPFFIRFLITRIFVIRLGNNVYYYFRTFLEYSAYFYRLKKKHDKLLEVLQYMTKIQLALYLAEDFRQAALYQKFLLRHYHQISH